jgi:hypothetical protein
MGRPAISAKRPGFRSPVSPQKPENPRIPAAAGPKARQDARDTPSGTACRVRPAAASDIPHLVLLIRRYWDFEGISGFDALRVELLLGRIQAEPRLG